MLWKSPCFFAKLLSIPYHQNLCYQLYSDCSKLQKTTIECNHDLNSALVGSGFGRSCCFTAARSYGVGSAHVGMADAYGATGASAAGVSLLGDETSFMNKPAAGSNYGQEPAAGHSWTALRVLLHNLHNLRRETDRSLPRQRAYCASLRPQSRRRLRERPWSSLWRWWYGSRQSGGIFRLSAHPTQPARGSDKAVLTSRGLSGM